MIDLYALERDLVDRATPTLMRLGFRVEQFPGNVEEFGKPTAKARAFVGLRMQRLQPPTSLSPRAQLVQQQYFQFQIIYQALELRSHENTLNALPAVQDCLSGYVPAQCSPHCLYLIESGLVEVVQGLWLYSQMYELPYPYLKRIS